MIQLENEINFFRIVQESLNNIVKHSKATAASVVVKLKENKIHLSIEDNGKGIDSAFANNSANVNLLGKGKRTLGLSGMSERAKILGGEIIFGWGESGGTKVNLVIPTEDQNEEE